MFDKIDEQIIKLLAKNGRIKLSDLAKQVNLSISPCQARLKKLEDIVEQLESGEIDIEQTAELYEKGMLLKNNCEEKLKKVELQIKKIKMENNKIQKEDFK